MSHDIKFILKGSASVYIGISFLGDSWGGEEGSWLTLSVMNDFSPKCSDTQDGNESSKSPTLDLPNINYRLKIWGKLGNTYLNEGEIAS